MELENVLLGLIRLHNGVTGYELNRILRHSTGYLMSASLSHIYPTLRKLRESGMVTYQDIPLTNRPNKKVYHISHLGEQQLQTWLEAPAEESLDLQPFFLKMAFSPLMNKATILEHIGREIDRLKNASREQNQGVQLEMDYLDKHNFDSHKAQVLWDGMYRVLANTRSYQVEWLQEWRQSILNELQE